MIPVCYVSAISLDLTSLDPTLTVAFDANEESRNRTPGTPGTVSIETTNESRIRELEK